MKKCKNKQCRKEFEPRTQFQCYCYDCILQKAKEFTQKKYDDGWKQRKKVGKESLKKDTDYKTELQKQINKIARLIDHNQRCISCQIYPKKKNGCHFRGVQSTPSLRYNLLNIYLGCEKCNTELGGNVQGYDDGLISEFGKEFWEFLKFGLRIEYPILQISRNELIEKIKIAKSINKLLESNLVENNSEQRIELRKKYNEIIGIYQK